MRDNTHRWWLIPLAPLCLAAAACSTPKTGGERSTAADAATGITWEWTETTTPDRRIEVATPGRYTVRFKDDGEARIRYDCNHGGGLYEMSDGRVTFTGPLTYTRIKCGEGSYSIPYRQQLGVVESFFTQHGDLYLELPDNGGTMRFRKAGDQ